MACKGQDQPCTWFRLEKVAYDDEVHCQLDSTTHEIEVFIKGQRQIGRGNEHNFELTLTDQGKPFSIEIAQKPPNNQAIAPSSSFHRGKYTKNGSLKSDQTLNVIFLIKKTASCPSSQHPINITCALRHMHKGLNIWCTTVHEVSLLLTAV